MRRFRAPALLDWRYELRCSDDGIGMDAAAVDRRLGALGVAPDASGQRGLFGRGLRDVWLAQGGGRIEGLHAGRLVESWFFPSGGDDPYAYVHVRDEEASAAARRELGLDGSGTRITVPLASGRLPANARLCAAFHTVAARALRALDQPVDSDALVMGDDSRPARSLVEKQALPREVQSEILVELLALCSES